MTDAAKDRNERALSVDEVVDYALTYLDYPLDVLDPQGAGGDMAPADHELARATIAYMGYRLLLAAHVKAGGSPGEAGWIAANSHRFEVRDEIAGALGVGGTGQGRRDEARRLYRVASEKWDADAAYRADVGWVMRELEEKHGLDASGPEIVFV